MVFFGNIYKSDYAWEISVFTKLRDFSDGCDVFECSAKYDRYIADHNPKFEISLVILNFVIGSFCVHNIYHVDPELESETGILIASDKL